MFCTNNGERLNDKGLGTKKLSYFTYKLLTQKIKDIDLDSTKTLTTGNDITFLSSSSNKDKRIYIAWYDYYLDPEYSEGGSAQITFNNLDSIEVKVTETVPTEPLFDALKSQTLKVVDHSVTIQLFQNPVYIEEVDNSPLSPPSSLRIIEI